MPKTNRQSTALYFLRPFISGIASIFSFGHGAIDIPSSAKTEMTDKEALESDWLAVGSDMRSAIDKYEREYATTRK